MKCKSCGGELDFINGIAVCTACGGNYKINAIFEDIDVSICYIETDLNGRRTKDSLIAQELYHKLESKRITTFFERISAANVIGDDLEQIRCSAILAAKVILVVATSVESFNTLSGKYSQYFSDKVVIPFCADVKPADIPKELGMIQALDYSSIGWASDMEQGILRILGREKEIDIAEVHKRTRKLHGILIGVAIALVLLVAGILSFIYFDKQAEDPASAPLTNQQLYNSAVDLVSEGKYLEAADVYAQISDYKDSKVQIESIFDRYDGYYQSEENKFSIYFNIKDAAELYLEMDAVTENGTSKATVEGVWEKTQQSYSFMDTFGNMGVVTITLNNDGIAINVQMEEVGDFASIGNQDVVFDLSQKTDKPTTLQITAELLRSWIQTPTTVEDITSLGFELVKDDNSKIQIGGGVMFGADLYRIANTDIKLFLYERDLTCDRTLYDINHMVNQHEATGSNPQIVCAVFTTAEYLIPEKIGQEAGVFLEGNTTFISGGADMYIEWGSPDVFIFFCDGEDEKMYSYTPTGLISADTKVGAYCKDIVGTGFFVRNYLLHTKTDYEAEGGFGEYSNDYVGENEYYYIFSDYQEGNIAGGYLINKITYELDGYTEIYCHYFDTDEISIYSEPTYSSTLCDTRKVEPNYRYYFSELMPDENGVIWGRLYDESGWVCLPDFKY